MITLGRTLSQSGSQVHGGRLYFFNLGCDFLYRGMQGFSGMTDDFWKLLLPQIAHADPGAHAACVVLGTAVMHRRDRTGERFLTVSKYYGRAILQIQHDLATRSTEMANIACMCFLLVMTDLLLNRPIQALSHLQGAIALLDSRQQKINLSRSIKPGSSSPKASDFAMVDAIDIAALSLDVNVSSYASEMPPRLSSPRIFDSSSFPGMKGQELRALLTLHSAYEFLNRASNFKYVPIRFHPQGIDVEHGRHIANMMSVAHALSLALSQDSAHSDRRLSTMRMQCHSCLIRLATILCPEECVYDTYTELFRCIIEDASVILQRHRMALEDKLGFSADLGLVQPLSITAMKCRDIDVRSAALNLLEQCGTDGPFDARVLAAISRRVIELETHEHELTSKPAHNWSDPVPESLRVCGCGPDLSRVRQVGDPRVTAFFSRCVDVSAMMAEQTSNGFEKSTHWQIWTETVVVDETLKVY